MVAMFEIAFLIVVVVLRAWWFRRTNLYRAHRRSPGDLSQVNMSRPPPPTGKR
jgi:hypothetical protein